MPKPNKAKEIAPETLHKLLRVDPINGRLYWRTRPREFFKSDRDWNAWNTRFADKEGFTPISDNGYKNGRMLGKTYRAHRVIYAMCHGEWPTDHIDHINGVRDDNRLCNLRAVTNTVNSRNARKSTNNNSGVTGVYWNKRGKNWRAQIKYNRKKHHLGSFACIGKAIAARRAVEPLLGFHANHGRTA